mmetsp:Transcript_7410/g.21719  ORF Transcript_7410/g.21719 Transcript_7410/m.21719 type:complete len:225 (-) Transcript_7410:2-676(-)|eukprot:CAMPEP_0119555864 /NCGR_PEP_ID=MMETSP1352-20130426/7961_1 /TAXON_ID=265584 /ORGANISM="Stauroneis constricta, Strain CCMP1120" /LENGTH=224 /DNA_ID=CAMNT_0007602717 /DNA_START=59 /DNA_END=730 /DNA_ORIENTATION=-
MDEIDLETGKALAKDMNTHFAAVVFGMAKEKTSLPFGTSLKSAKVKTVNNRGCVINIVTCKSDVCEMKVVAYPFRPYLKSRNELKRRLIVIRNKVCAPKLYWLVTKPLALLIFVVCLGLGYATLFLGYRGMITTFAQAPRLDRGISAVFGNSSRFAKYIQGSFYISVAAHFVEALIAAVGCSTTLGLNAEVTLSWFILVFMVGFPIFQEFNLMMSAQQAPSKSK